MSGYNKPQLLVVLLRSKLWDTNCMNIYFLAKNEQFGCGRFCISLRCTKIIFFRRKMNSMDMIMSWYNKPQLLLVVLEEDYGTKNVQTLIFAWRKVNCMDRITGWYNQPQLLFIFLRRRLWGKKCTNIVFLAISNVWMW